VWTVFLAQLERTSLCIAAMQGHLDAVELLIKKGANIEHKEANVSYAVPHAVFVVFRAS
jgi:hypothetical protein